jgi:hypothetical protein
MKTRLLIPIIIIILTSITIASCGSTPTVSAPSTSGNHAIVCEVFYRGISGGPLETAPEIRFSNGNDQHTHTFDQLTFSAIYQDDEFEGRALSIVITNSDGGTEISRQLYQFDPQNPVENQFIGGHGFTGLNYVFLPESAAEIQYFCSTK